MSRMKTLLFISLLALAFAGCGAKPVGLSDGSTNGSTNGPASPTVSLAANPTSVASGGTSTLNWSSTGATSCSASGAWSGSKATSGSQSTGSLTANSSYALTCTGSGGNASASASVNVVGSPPSSVTVSLAANPTSVASGGTSTLTWSSTNATSCTASGGWSGARPTSGSESTPALSTTTLFNLACTGTGSASTSAGVLVVPPPGSLPAWVNALAIGQWYEIPNTEMVSVDGAHLQGAWSKVIAWTSFVVDTRTSKVYSVANGGHNDYDGNEVDALDLERAQPVWTEVLAPTPGPQRIDCSAYYADGRPTSRHTYYGVTFNEFDDRIMLLGGAWACGAGGFFHAMSSYNITANTYNGAGTHPDLSGTFVTPAATVANPFTGDIYLNLNRVMGRWNRATNTFTNDLNATGPIPWGVDSMSAFDTSRSRMFILGGQNVDAGYYTLATNSATAVTLSGANAADVAATGTASMTYVPALDRYLVRKANPGGTVYQINASTFEVTTLVTAGGTSIPPTPNGPYNKFLYVPRLNGAVYVPCYKNDPNVSCPNGNVWFLRLH